MSQIIENWIQQIQALGLGASSFALLTVAVATVATLASNLDKIFSLVLKYRAATPLSEQQLLTFRAALLKQMKQDTAQRLEDSLHNLIRVDLAREEQRHQVGRRTGTLSRTTDKEELKPVNPLHSLIKRSVAIFSDQQKELTIPPGEQTYRIFHRDDVGERLLILGEPGAGKTTELLTVAKRLVEEALEDDKKPVPLLFELSSWTPDTPILEWFQKQLQQAYGVADRNAEKLASQWVQQNQIMPLLDGLDELGGPNQTACITALESFLVSHGALSALVCCRREEYEQGGQQIQQLKGAVYLQSIALDQVHKYLRALDREQLWEQLQGQPELLELAQRPLFLTILVVAYQGRPIRNRLALFDAYTRKQLHDPNHQGTYGPRKNKTPRQTLRYLTWLARQLEQRNETEFLIENLQPSCLSSKVQRLLYRLVFGLTLGLLFGLVLGVTGGLIAGLGSGAFIGGIGGVVDQWISALSERLLNREFDLPIGELIGKLIGRLFGALIGGLSGGLLGALVGALLGVLKGGLDKITPAEKLKWSIRRGLKGGLKGALILGLIGGLTLWIRSESIFYSLVGALAFGLIGELIFGLGAGLTAGLSKSSTLKKQVPNQGIKKSLQNSLIFGLIGTLIFGLSTGIIFGLIFSNLGTGLIFGLGAGLVGGLSSALSGGLKPTIQHYALRSVLTLTGCTPWDYSLFLEHAVKHRFIQRTGGRYRFIHDLLRKHFAQMTPEQRKLLAQAEPD